MKRLIIASMVAIAAIFAAATELGAQAQPDRSMGPTPGLLQGMSFRGEVRLRSEWEHPLVAPADLFTLARTRFAALASLRENTGVLVELQDSRVLGGNSAGALQLHQGFLEIAPGGESQRFRVRAGRQEIALGNERLIGRVNWSNTGRAFDGARLMLNGAWPASLFVATVEERGVRYGAQAAGTPVTAEDQLVAGAFVSRAAGIGTLEATLVHDRGMRARAREVSGRTTVDGRVRSTRLFGLRTELEGAYQFGSQRAYPAPAFITPPAEDISAWLVGARLGTPVATGPGATPPLVAAVLGADVLSGDARAAEGARGGAFHTLFATNHPFYGLMDLFGDPGTRTAGAGLTDLFLATTFTTPTTRRLTLRADVHHMSATSGGGVYGWEGDFVAALPLSSVASVELGYSAFRTAAAGERIALAPDGATRQWSYLQLSAGF